MLHLRLFFYFCFNKVLCICRKNWYLPASEVHPSSPVEFSLLSKEETTWGTIKMTFSAKGQEHVITFWGPKKLKTWSERSLTHSCPLLSCVMQAQATCLCIWCLIEVPASPHGPLVMGHLSLTWVENILSSIHTALPPPPGLSGLKSRYCVLLSLLHPLTFHITPAFFNLWIIHSTLKWQTSSLAVPSVFMLTSVGCRKMLANHLKALLAAINS